MGHTHAPAVNGILCSPRARELAERRVFPDEIVCCDVAFGLCALHRSRLAVGTGDSQTYRSIHSEIPASTPRVVLLENHGIITLGKTAEAVLAAMLIAEKAAGIWLGAATLGGPDLFIAETSGTHCRTAG